MSAEVPTPYDTTPQRHAETHGFIQEGGDKEDVLLDNPVAVGTKTPFETTPQRHADTRGFIHAGGDKEQAFLEANGFLTPEGEEQVAHAEAGLEATDEDLRSDVLSPLAQLALDTKAAKLNWDQNQYEAARAGMIEQSRPKVLDTTPVEESEAAKEDEAVEEKV